MDLSLFPVSFRLLQEESQDLLPQGHIIVLTLMTRPWDDGYFCPVWTHCCTSNQWLDSVTLCGLQMCGFWGRLSYARENGLSRQNHNLCNVVHCIWEKLMLCLHKFSSCTLKRNNCNCQKYFIKKKRKIIYDFHSIRMQEGFMYSHWTFM